MPVRSTPTFTPSKTLDLVSAAVREKQQSGVKFTHEWLAKNPGGGTLDVQNSAFASLIPPPKDTTLDSATVREAVGTRTRADFDAARWLNKNGDGEVWFKLLRDWQSTVGPADARRGQRELMEALTVANDIVFQAKRFFRRNRPYIDDPKLPTVPYDGSLGAHSSYPSGHASTSFAAASILGSLMPDRVAEFQRLAESVAYSRVISGHHYPSDVAAGAYVGALVGCYVVSKNSVR